MTRRVDVALTDRSTLELFPLQVRRDAERFVAGRPSTGSYVEVSVAALEAAELLARGRPIADAKAALAAPRLRPLLETLLEAGLVKSVDGVPLVEPLPPRRYHLAFLQRRHVAWLFSWPAAFVYLAVVVAGASILCAQPRYLPRAADALVTASAGRNLALLWGISLLAMAAHELAHLLAATFLGARGSFALGYRLFFAVAQTDLTDLWLVDRGKRYLAYAAGMANDVLLASGAIVALWLHDRHVLPCPPLLYGALRAAVLVLVLGVLWQFNFYLRTDVYYLIANWTGCRNLQRDATAYLKRRLQSLLTGAAPAPLAGVPEREMRIVRAYAVLMVVGTAAVTVAGAVYLGAVLSLLLGRHALLAVHPVSARLAFEDQPALLVSLGLTCCWLACAVFAKRRRQPCVSYRLIAPEDL